jgi:ankyrin repeat protein
MNENTDKRIKASFQLFDRLKCYLADLNVDFDNDTALALMEVDKMRCLILNCIAGLNVVENERSKQNGSEINQSELVKRKAFAEAVAMMMSGECYKNQAQNAIVSAFPDDSKMNDERSWLSMHYAAALTVENKISEEDILILQAANPLDMHLFSEKDKKGYTPIHLLCMQKRPKISLVRKICLRDPQAFVLCDYTGKSALHYVAQYSESLEMLQIVLQIDHSLTQKRVVGPYDDIETAPLGLLCGRSDFSSFRKMFLCLIEVDNTVKVIYDGVTQCIRQYKDFSYHDISPGSRFLHIKIFHLDIALILLGNLIDANPDVANYGDCSIFHCACMYLRREMGIDVLSLFLRKNKEGIKSFDDQGYLPIHYAAEHSCLKMIKFLLEIYPESLTMVISGEENTAEGCNLLHQACENDSKIADSKAIVEYLCKLCPALVHMKSVLGDTPLHLILGREGGFKMEAVKILCNTDESVVRDKCTPTDVSSPRFQQLPLHFLIAYSPPSTEVSHEGDCFRLFLQLYPASAGVKDGDLETPYDLAVSKGLSVYFIRLLLSCDSTVDPVQRRNLNYGARREGIFLAFRALSTSVEPTIWAKLRHEHRDLLQRVISYL